MIEALIPIEHTVVDGIYTRIAYAVKGQVIIGCPHKKGGNSYECIRRESFSNCKVC